MLDLDPARNDPGSIVAMTRYDNTASIGVMRKLGMHIEHNVLQEPPWLQVVGILEKR